MVSGVEISQHIFGVSAIEGLLGDDPNNLNSLGTVFGPAGDIINVGIVQTDGQLQKFRFTQAKQTGKILKIVIRKTPWVNAFALYRLYPLDELGNRIPLALSTAVTLRSGNDNGNGATNVINSGFAKLAVRKNGGGMELRWNSGLLLESGSLSKKPILWITNLLARSPYLVVPTDSSRFFGLTQEIPPTGDIINVNCFGISDWTVPSVENIGPAKTEEADQIRCTVRDVNLAGNFEEIAMYSPGQLLWAGDMVSGRSVMAGTPNEIVVKRKPLTVSVIGLGLSDNTRSIDDPFLGSVDAAVSDILRKNVGDARNPAIITSDFVESFTRDQVSIKVGLASLLSKAFSAGFNFSNDSSQRSVFFKVFQKYYTVTIRRLSSGADYIADTETCTNLNRQLLTADVPVIIGSIDYGRLLIYQLTTSANRTAADLEAAFTYKVIEGNVGGNYEQIFDECEKRILVLGGDPVKGVEVVATQQAKAFFDSGARWGLDSPGFPLVYRFYFLQPGMPVFSYGTSTDFQIRECAPLAGDNQYTMWEFGCDRGNDNFGPLNRDGSPVCGSGNCNQTPGLPESSNTCWHDPRKIGSVDGSLTFNGPKDTQFYGRTYLYAADALTISTEFDGDVAAIWLNDNQVTQAKLNLALKKGWNKLEFTLYNQNQGSRIRIGPLANKVIRMQSDGQ